MAETLLNSSSDTGGDGIRLLRAHAPDVVNSWAARAAALPAGKEIGGPESVAEITAALPIYLGIVFERTEFEPSHEGAALKALAERLSASGVPLAAIERAFSLLQDVTVDYARKTIGSAPAVLDAVMGAVLPQLDEARADLAQCYMTSTLRKLQEAEDKYLSFMKNVSDAFFVCSAQDLTILETNRRAEEVSGHKTGALVGMRLADLEKPPDGRIIPACRHALTERQTVSLDNVELVRRDGSTIIADVRISALYGDYAAQPTLLVAVHDTTIEREVERRMQSFSDQLNHTATEKTEEIAALTRLTSAISSGLEMDRFLQVVIFEIGKLIPFDKLSILLMEDDGQHYRVMASAGPASDHPTPGAVFPAKDSIVEQANAERKPIVRNDLPPADGKPGAQEAVPLDGVRSFICAPLATGQNLVGALLLGSTAQAAFGARESRILQDIGEEVAVAMQWAKLRELERRRKAEMKIINEVGREAMSTLNLKALLKTACTSIQKNFTFYDVSIFLVDWGKNELELAAHSGVDAGCPAEGWRTKIGGGPISRAVQSSGVILENDVSRSTVGPIGPEEAQPAGSQLCVPIKIAGRVDGVLCIRCKEANAFDDNAVSALATLSDLIARAIENARLYQHTCSLRELNENIIATMPSALLVLDESQNVLMANSAYCKITNMQKKDVEGKSIRQLWDSEFLADSGLLVCLTESLQTGKGRELTNIRHNRSGRQMVLNFSTSYMTAGEKPRLLLIIDDVTETVERAFQLSMLREINEAIQGTLELDKILRLVLTCVTAGHALGFNRGFLLMVDKRNNRLEGTTGIGPLSLDDARSIYSDESLRSKSLKQLLNECDFSVRKEDLPLYKLARKLMFSLDDDEIVVKTVKEKKPYLVHDAMHDERVSKRLRELLGANSFVSVPLVAKDEVIGVILSDNLYSGHPITQERAELLAIFANHAGLAIENGESYSRLQDEIRERTEAYQRLEEMKEKEVRTSQLAAVGEMAARVAHEIRNPLVTIGGYARAILKSLSPEDDRYRKADVIVGEVMRLEKILTGVVDFSKPATPSKAILNLDAIVDQVTEFIKPQLTERNIHLERVQHSKLPQISADAIQLRQALLNIVKNAIEAIERDGKITISTEFDGEMIAVDIIDTGPGIMDDVRANLFNLFYTTKPGGTGLGLAITRKIIEDHHGFLNVESSLGEGTTFSVYLPVRVGGDDGPPLQAPVQGGPQL